MNIEKIPNYILTDLKERGLTPERIVESNVDDLFIEYCNWHGLSGWGEGLLTVLDDLNYADDDAPA